MLFGKKKQDSIEKDILLIGMIELYSKKNGLSLKEHIPDFDMNIVRKAYKKHFNDKNADKKMLRRAIEAWRRIKKEVK